MSQTYDSLKAELFAGELPHFPQDLQEYWQIAILLRRKYLDAKAAGDSEMQELFAKVANDMERINSAYGWCDTLANLMLEVYDDICRQLDPLRRDSRIEMLLKVMRNASKR